MQVADGIFASCRRDSQIVVQSMMPDFQLAAAGIGPLISVYHAEGEVHRETSADAEVGIEWVRVAAVRMNVTGHRTLFPRFTEHVGVAGIQTLDSCVFVSCREWRDQMVLQSEVKD